MIQALTFDVTHTLIQCPRLGEIYAGVLARHGVAVEPGEARRLIGAVWQEFACAAEPGRDRFTSHPGGAGGFWRRFLERFCEHLDAPPPSPFAAAELFHLMSRAAAWEVFPEVPAALDELRRRGLRLGVISNWDHRLPVLLRRLDLRRRFDGVVYSAAAGVEKPDPRIFRQAVAAMAAAPPARRPLAAEEVLHVGDHRLEDVEGALGAGLQAVRLVRSTERQEPAPALVVHDLAALTRLLESGRLIAAPAPPPRVVS